MPPEAERLYGKMIEAVRRATIEIAQETGIEAREVAEVIGRALTAKRPRTRYLVGTDAKIRGADGEGAARPPDGPRDRAAAGGSDASAARRTRTSPAGRAGAPTWA